MLAQDSFVAKSLIGLKAEEMVEQLFEGSNPAATSTEKKQKKSYFYWIYAKIVLVNCL